MINLIKSAAKRMLVDFEDSKHLGHQPTKGRAREYSVFEQFLRPYLPARYSVSSGIVIDANSKQSRQQDLIVYDELYSPKLLDIESDKIVFVESVFAVLEVKSVLNRKELKDIIKKSSSIWQLSKSPQPSISLVSGMMIPASHAPVLCIGICFESQITLDVISSSIREFRNDIEAGYAMSILCVLHDKDGKSGLFVNVSSDNLAQLQLIPSPSSRVSLVRVDGPGDALLHLYLLLMEHLRYSGLLTPGPNLIHYAQLAGLKLPTLNVTPSEMRGAFIDLEGKRTSVDTLESIRVLSMKALQGSATDSEILDWFLLLPQMSSGEAILNPQSLFFVNGKSADLPGTHVVYKAIERFHNGEGTNSDELLAKQLISLIRSVSSKNAEIWMGTPPPPSSRPK